MTPETPKQARARLVTELRKSNHTEAADLLETDGRAGELEISYGTWSPGKHAHAKLQEFGTGEHAERFAREFADMYRAEAYENAVTGLPGVHADPEAVGVWRLVSEWMPMVGYEDPATTGQEDGG